MKNLHCLLASGCIFKAAIFVFPTHRYSHLVTGSANEVYDPLHQDRQKQSQFWNGISTNHQIRNSTKFGLKNLAHTLLQVIRLINFEIMT